MRLKSTFLKILLTLIFFITCGLGVAQNNPIPVNKNMAQSLAKSAYSNNSNIKFGIGYTSFVAKENQFGAGKTLFNTLGYYVAYTGSTPMSTNVHLDYEIQLGRKNSKNIAMQPDMVSITNYSSMNYFFAEIPFQLSIRQYIKRNLYWSVKPGMYLNYMVDTYSEIKNNQLEGSLEDNEFRKLDLGGALSFELGFRAGYIGVDNRIGWRNLAPEALQSTHTIKNAHTIGLYFGYRFGTDIGKSDANRIKNLTGK